ncbi:MAG TPA: GAF domain-containing sensor histidine kinase [Ktedonobacterales bacterium]|nr:GAF domain-containing sensor histidine kinase [Ktedonobacterales bacterium]
MAEYTPRKSDQKLKQRNRELSILNTIASELNGSVDLPQALHAALEQVAELLELSTGWIWLLDEDSGEPYLATAQNLPPALANNPSKMEGRCYCLDTFQAGDLEGAANINVVRCSRLKNLIEGTRGLRYHASIPLYAHGKQLGVLNVASPDWRELSPEDLRILHTVGDLLGIAIERARLFARSTQLGAAEERNRLAREIHDTLAQGLAGIVLQLETADALTESPAASERVHQAIQRALALTRANLEEARRSVLDLRAAPLEGRTLAQALEALACELAGTSGIDIKFEVTGASQPLPVRIEIGLYRIVQEALTNVARHAQARHVTIRLVTTPKRLTCTIRDDGNGFDPTHVPQGRYGLIGMRERTRLLGGSLRLESTPKSGTRLEVVVPLEGA